jgi:hypothetical protein
VVTLAEVQALKPIIYVPRELPGFEFQGVIYELFADYAVLWYWWPADGLPDKPDYEPVILVVDNGRLTRIGIRPHKRYYDTKWSDDFRPTIVFETGWHGPVLEGDKNSPRSILYNFKRASILLDDYKMTPGKPPHWYIKDGTKVSVYDYAKGMLI